MGFLNLFSKPKEDELRYHAAARVLINGCCDVSESEELSKHLSLTEDELSDFHTQKRHLALKTVFFTAAITMEPKKRNLFVKIFADNIKTHDKVMSMPKGVKEMYEKMNYAIDGAYLSVFQDVTNNLNATKKEPVDSLMENFSELFAILIEQKGSKQYIEIGKIIFQKHHRIATHALNSL